MNTIPDWYTKVRVRHINSDLCLTVANETVVASEYKPDPSFWWHVSEDDSGFVYFTNLSTGEMSLSVISKGDDKKLVASKASSDFECAWLFTENGAIYSMFDANSDDRISLHVPKNAKSGEAVQLCSNKPADAFVLEPVPKFADPVRLTVQESYERHCKEFQTPPGLVN